MPLIPKISVLSTDTLQGKTVTLKDTTGSYNAGSNPGGYGTPNFGTADLDWAVLGIRNFKDDSVTYRKLDSLAGILGSGEEVTGTVDGKFPDGVYELKYYPVVAHPVTADTDTTITWTAGSKQFSLTDADTLLAGVKAIILKSISETKLYFIDTTKAATSAVAYVTEALPAEGTSAVALAYEADGRFMIAAAGDACLAKAIAQKVRECTCYDDEMKSIFLRQAKRLSVDTFFTQENYQAAHDLIIRLEEYCNGTSNCGC